MRAQLFKLKDLKNLPVLNLILKRHDRKFRKFSQDLVLRQIIREIINEMVKDIILNTKKNIRKNNIKNIIDVYKSQYPIVYFSKKMSLFDVSIKKFLKEKMYHHKSVIEKTSYGKKVIKGLFLKIRKNPKEYININNVKKSDIDRSICDFIAGMTDRFAINLHNKSK